MKRDPFCPSDDTLLGLLRGTDREIDVPTTGSHVLHCSDCQSKIDGFLKREPSLGELRAAHAAGGVSTAHRTVIEQIIRRIRPAAARTTMGAEVAFLAPPLPGHPDDLGTLDRYRVLAMLGKGGMGIVFRAVDPTLEREVALKVIIPKYAANEKLRKRFLAEARSTVAVRSPHVAEVYDCGIWNEIPYLTMELLNGVSLDRRPMPMPVDAWRRIGFGIAKGLADAHRVGMIHRDLKPGNIHLGTDARTGKPTVKIIDFGLARPLERAVELTNAGETLGTPAYMSPEQAAAKKVDHRTDLYALGVILFQLATGKLPYASAGQGVFALLSELASPEPLASVAKLAPQTPPALVGLIDRLLAKDPEKRPASADEVLATIRESFENDRKAPANDVVASAAYVSVPQVAVETAPYLEQPSTVPSQAFAELGTRSERESTAPPQTARPRPVWLLPAACMGILLVGLAIGFALGAFGSPGVTVVLNFEPSPDLEVSVDGAPVKVIRDPDSGKAAFRAPRRTIALIVRRGGAVVIDDKQFNLVSERGARIVYPEIPKPATASIPKRAPDPIPPPPPPVTVVLSVHLDGLPRDSEVLIDGRPARLLEGTNPQTTVARIEIVRLARYRLVVRHAVLAASFSTEIVLPADADTVQSVPNPIEYRAWLNEWKATVAARDRTKAVRVNNGIFLEAPGGSWKRTAEELFLAPGAPEGISRIVFGDVNWKDCDYSFEFKRTHASAKGAGLCFRSTRNDDQYNLTFPEAGNDYFRLESVEFGWPRSVQAYSSRLDVNVWYGIGVVVRGNKITVLLTVNGAKPKVIFDMAHAAHARGQVGLRVDRTGGVLFRKISVKSPEGDLLWDGLPDVEKVDALPPPLYEDSIPAEWFVEQKGAEKSWTAEGKTIAGTNTKDVAGRSYLLSKEEYGDFKLKFAYRMDLPNSVGGIAIRATSGEQLPLGIRNVQEHPFLLIAPTVRPEEPTGTGYYLTNEFKLPPKLFPLGLAREWRPAEVVVRGDTLTFSVDNRTVAEYRHDPKIPARQIYAPGLLRKTGRVGFRINAGKISFKDIQVEELPKENAVVVPPPPPPPPAGDPFKPDTTWRGVKIVDRGDEPGQTSFYELGIESRTGNAFAGTVAENGAERRTLAVTGTVANNAIEWKEIDRQNPTRSTAVSGTYAEGMLTLDIKEGALAGSAGSGKAKLFRNRLAAARDTFDEFYPIFNGKNLDAWWNTENVDTYGWGVTKQGILIGTGNKFGHLYSKHTFGDIHLWCRVRINDGGRGGAFVRGNYGPAGTDQPEGYFARVSAGFPKEPSGSLQAWDKWEPSKLPNAVKPNRWFDLETIVAGNEVTVKVDGKETVKFKDIKVRPPMGRIVLQQFDAKSTVEFAMIAVKELKPK